MANKLFIKEYEQFPENNKLTKRLIFQQIRAQTLCTR